jgi:STE24 endopeptidase
LVLYLTLLALEHGWETLLNIMNQRYVAKKKRNPPQQIAGIMTREAFSRSADYTLTRSRFSLGSSFFPVALLLVLILTGWLGVLERSVSALAVGIYTEGVLFFFLISFIFTITSLPFGYYSQFVIEERFGFNKMTLRLFLVDLLKSAGLSLLLLTPLLYGLFWFMDSAGRFWWIFAFLGFTLFRLLVSVVYPVLIAPLFNRFTPLEEGALKDKITGLADRLRFRTRGIFLMDGSRRSKHSNAYFTGLGRSKRVVLFDTLVRSLEEDALLSVIAHEIGHEKRRHVLKNLALSLAVSLAGFWIISLLLPYAPFFQAFGFDEASYHAAVVLVAFCAGPFTFYLSPLLAIWSRKHEYAADRFAVKVMGTSKGLRNALIQLNRNNLKNLTPHPWYSFYHYSHPTLLERVEAMEGYEKNQAS